MQLLFYTHAFDGGGAELVFATLARALADDGHHVIFAADHPGHDAPSDGSNLEHVLLPAGHLPSTRELAAILRREKPDASFSALGAQNLKHFTASLCAGRRAHCVLGYHGFAAAEPKRLSRLSFWLSPLITRLAARTICVSDALREDVLKRWFGSRKKTVRIYNPLTCSAPNQGYSRDSQNPLILACGRLVPVKRFSDVVAALASMKTEHASLAIVGEGPERRSIEAAARRFGVEHRVRLPGHVSDLEGWYRKASCLVVASESESFGLTVAEALSFGVPVVSTDCGGPTEILEGGRLGRIVPIGDVEALGLALDQTLAAPGDAAPRHERAKAFSLPVIRDAYATLARSLASSSSRKRPVAGE